MKSAIAITAVSILTTLSLQAANSLFITEVDPAGSAASYAVDWFELTNTGTSAIDMTGWKMDDNSGLFASAVALRTISGLATGSSSLSIAAGQSIVFFEGIASGTTDATLAASFESAWFGTNVPSGFTIDAYGGSGVGLSQSNDAVNIFNSTGTIQAAVNFNVSTLGATFDNAADVNGTVANGSTISTLSVAGTNGAFHSFNGAEVGSPGAVPEPTTGIALVSGIAALVSFRRRRA